AEQPAEPRLPFGGARGQAADLLLAPTRPADLGGVRALARGRDDTAVDHQPVGIGVKAELAFDPVALSRRYVLVPHGRRLDDMAVASEDRKILGLRHDVPSTQRRRA